MLNWNGASHTVACVASVAKELPAGGSIIVVDNGSRSEDVERVADALRAYPCATLIRNTENLGFAGGCNVGITQALAAGAEYVLLLNNDTIVEAGALATLVRHMADRPRTGLASPIVLDMSGERVWAAGGVRAMREVVCRLGFARALVEECPDEPFEPYALIGCAIIARREALESIGPLDEDYFAYVEDVDYSLRAQQAGWVIEVVPKARIRHAISASTGGIGYSPRRGYLLARGTALFVRRSAALDQRIGFFVMAPIALLAATVRELFHGGLQTVAAKFRGYVDGLLERPVSDRYVSE